VGQVGIKQILGGLPQLGLKWAKFKAEKQIQAPATAKATSWLKKRTRVGQLGL
jgi:hypothetical protein